MNDLEKKTWLRRHFINNERILLRYVMRFVDVQVAKEVVQESFIQLMHVDPPDKVFGKELPWLFRVCRNRALDKLKKDGRMKNFNPGDDVPFEGESADQTLSRNQEKSAVDKLVSQLNPNHREVLRLKFQEGLSYKEISEVTGHSVSHVGVILHESIANLRKQMSSQKVTGGAQ